MPTSKALNLDTPGTASSRLLRRLADRHFVPKHIQLTSVGDGYFASVYDDDVGAAAISDKVSIGFDRTLDLATLKGIVEWIERSAFRTGAEKALPGCHTPRSDGFAAFPVLSQTDIAGKSAARQNAYCEAVERYVWATWWDKDLFSHTIHAELTIYPAGLCVNLLHAAREQVRIDRFEIIRPTFAPTSGIELIIIAAHLKQRGVLTGGAVGPINNPIVWERAAAELFRHSLALRRMVSGESVARSFYEERIVFFGTGQGDELTRSRLSSIGSHSIELPGLAFDAEIPHDHDDIVCVHRCLFENQPPFIGGHLERLCF